MNFSCSSVWLEMNEVKTSKTKLEVRFVSSLLIHVPIKSVMNTSPPNFSRASAKNQTSQSVKQNKSVDNQVRVNPATELKLKEFHLAAPAAESVKLAADFTNWDKFPLDMIKSEDGVWFTIVPLSCGTYTYRFIVDGRWCDDPHSPQHAPNPFGTANAVINIV